MPAGIAAIERVRTLGGEGPSAALANLNAGRRHQAPLLQLFPVADIAAFLVIAVFLGPNSGVEHSAAALTDDPADRGHGLVFALDLSFIVAL